MRLTIDTLSAVVKTAAGEMIKFDQRYPLGDNVHEFLVRKISARVLMFEIRLGKKTIVQRGAVRFLSATAGTRSNGEPKLQHYVLELQPDKLIYPISKVVDALLSAGIKDWQISPIFEDTLADHTASWSSPRMQSDGNITCDKLPARELGGEELMPTDRFTVSGAAWAIMSHDNRVSHVYLWSEAEKHVDTILTAIQQIQENGAPVGSA